MYESYKLALCGIRPEHRRPSLSDTAPQEPPNP